MDFKKHVRYVPWYSSATNKDMNKTKRGTTLVYEENLLH